MRQALAMTLLLVGIVLAAAFGARNGATHTAYRSATPEIALLEQAIAAQEKLAEGGEAAEGVADPLPPLREAGLLKPGESLEEALEQARAHRARVGLPQPRQRLVEWFAAGGVGWFAGVLLIGAGALLARRDLAARSSGEGITTGRVDFPGTVATLRERVVALREAIADLPMDDTAPTIRDRIDALATDLIFPVVEGRGQLVARHGIGSFAEYFGPFSSGERLLARAWSALTDGHAPTAREALEAAEVAFAQASEAWERIEGKARTPGKPEAGRAAEG